MLIDVKMTGGLCPLLLILNSDLLALQLEGYNAIKGLIGAFEG